jgi:hypothetical protein
MSPADGGSSENQQFVTLWSPVAVPEKPMSFEFPLKMHESIVRPYVVPKTVSRLLSLSHKLEYESAMVGETRFSNAVEPCVFATVTYEAVVAALQPLSVSSAVPHGGLF